MITIVPMVDRILPRLNFHEQKHITIAVIAPHQDDLEIGVGGTIARIKSEEQNRVSIIELVITDSQGFVRSYRTEERNIPQYRRTEALRGASTLLVDVVDFLGFSTIKNSINQTKAQAAICEFLLRQQPDILFIPHPHIDRHETHRIAARLTIEALESLPGTCDPLIIAYPVWAPFPNPNLYVDISFYVELKRRAINHHITQVIDRDYANAVIGLYAYYALGVPNQDFQMFYTEAFHLF